MNAESEKTDGAPDGTPGGTTPGGTTPDGPDTPPRPEQGDDDLPAEPPVDPLAAAEAEVAALNDKLLRAMAELENFRRRAEKERKDAAKYAIASFARDCLTLLDNLRRGLDSVSAADREANPALETLAAGMELTERETLATLERHGIKKIDPLGKPFDHNLHQAMLEVEDATTPAGSVAQVMQAGYVLNGRLLRPALVAIAKGGAKGGAAARDTVAPAPIANEDLANPPDEKGNGG